LAVVVLDGAPPDVHAIDFVRRTAKKRHALPIVALSPRGDDARIITLIRAGVCGCLYSDEAESLFILAVRDALDGGRPMSRGIAPLRLEHIRRSERSASKERAAVRPLTERERVMLGYMARGLSYEEIGVALGVSVNTVRTFVRAVYDKLDVAS